jgi:hypothetical protein
MQRVSTRSSSGGERELGNAAGENLSDLPVALEDIAMTKVNRAVQTAMAIGLLVGARGCSSGDSAAANREACYPACVVKAMAPCPLVSTCMLEIQSKNPNISDPNQDDGVGSCFASGEKTWDTSDAAGDEVVYVEASDGSLCYQVVVTDLAQTYTMYVNDQPVAVFNYDTGTQNTTAVCPDGTSKLVPAGLPCQRLPWINVASCDQGACSFGALPPGADTTL